MKDMQFALWEWHGEGMSKKVIDTGLPLAVTVKNNKVLVPYTIESLECLTKVLPGGMLVNDLARFRNYMTNTQNIEFTEYDRSCYPSFLRGYQIKDVEKIKYITDNHPYGSDELGRGAMLLDEPRTGKTLKSIVINEWLHKERGVKYTIYVTPATLTTNITTQAKTFLDKDYVCVRGNAVQRQEQYASWEGGTLVVSKDTLKTDWGKIKASIITKWRSGGLAVFIDEAHFLRNYKGKGDTAQIKMAMAIATQASYRYVMTGSVTSNHNKDFYGLLRFCFPKVVPTKWDFIYRYFDTHNQFIRSRKVVSIDDVKPQHEKELFGIKEGLSTQRLQSEVLTWANPLEKNYIFLDMLPKQKKVYEMLENGGVLSYDNIKDRVDTQVVYPEGVGEIICLPENAMNMITKYKQMSNNPLTILGDTDYIYKSEIQKHMTMEDSKFDFIKKWLKENPDEQLIVVSFFRGYLEYIHNKLAECDIESFKFIGSTKPEELEDAKQVFQEGNLRVLLGQSTVIGTGHTLDSCNNIIFTDLDWNPEQNRQVESRIIDTIDKGGDAKNIIVLINNDTFDYKIVQALEEKWEQSKLLKEVSYICTDKK